jgi:hypothetical protein
MKPCSPWSGVDWPSPLRLYTRYQNLSSYSVRPRVERGLAAPPPWEANTITDAHADRSRAPTFSSRWTWRPQDQPTGANLPHLNFKLNGSLGVVDNIDLYLLGQNIKYLWNENKLIILR